MLQGGVLALGNKAALGTGTLTFNTANSTLRAEGMDLTGANAIANTWVHNNAASNVITLGGRRDFGGTFNIELSGGGTFKAPGAAERHFIQVDDTRVTATLSGVIGGGNDNFVLDKSGIGTLVLKGNNTFDVRDSTGSGVALGQTDGISVTGGILRVAHSNALGSGDATFANVNVRGDLGAVLEIDGSGGAVNIINKHLILFNPDNAIARGLLNRSSSESVYTGTLRNLSGDNSVTGQIDLRNIADNGNAGTNFIGSDSGRLILNGQIIGTEKVPLDDRELARKALGSRP